MCIDKLTMVETKIREMRFNDPAINTSMGKEIYDNLLRERDRLRKEKALEYEKLMDFTKYQR